MRNSSTTRLNNLLVSCTIMDPKLQHGWYESKSWKQGVIKNTWYNCDFEEDQWEGQRTYQRRFHLIYTNVRPTIREIPSCKLSYIPYVLMNSPLASQSRDSCSPRNHPKNVNRFLWMDLCGSWSQSVSQFISYSSRDHSVPENFLLLIPEDNDCLRRSRNGGGHRTRIDSYGVFQDGRRT